MLVWHVGGNSVTGRHNKCGNPEHETRVGEVTLQSAETPAYWRSRGSVDFLHVYLPTADLKMQTTVSGLRGDVIDSLGVAFSSEKALKSSLQALRNAAKAGPMHEMELHAWTHMIIGQVLRVFGQTTAGQTKLEAKPISDAVRAQVRALVEDRFDEKITLDDMAALTGWDVYRFSRAFRNTVGQPPHQYILARRIEKARGLLADTTVPLSEIAYASGFSSQQHMTNLFSKHIGISPRRAVLNHPLGAANVGRRRGCDEDHRPIVPDRQQAQHTDGLQVFRLGICKQTAIAADPRRPSRFAQGGQQVQQIAQVKTSA